MALGVSSRVVSLNWRIVIMPWCASTFINRACVILFFVVRRKELLCLFYLRVVLTVLVFDGAQLTGSAM